MPLQKQVNFFRQFSANASRSCDLLDARAAEPIHGTEPLQQKIFPILAHPGTIVEYAFFDTFFHEQLMICVSEPMGFIADSLKQSQGRGIYWKLQRQPASGSINFLVFFCQADNRKIVQAQSLQFTAGG